MKKTLIVIAVIIALGIVWYVTKPAGPQNDIAVINDTSTGDILAETEDADTESMVEETRPADGVTPPEGEEYVVMNDSQVMRTGTKVAGAHYGTVNVGEGFVRVNDGDIIDGQIVIDMTTIVANDTDSQRLHDHLRSDDFFAVADYPTATFDLTNIGEDEITGDLTIRGQTNSITVPATVTMEDDMITVQSAFALDRTRWNIPAVEGVSEYMDVAFDLTFTSVE